VSDQENQIQKAEQGLINDQSDNSQLTVELQAAQYADADVAD
jgi:hypothetical protein